MELTKIQLIKKWESIGKEIISIGIEKDNLFQDLFEMWLKIRQIISTNYKDYNQEVTEVNCVNCVSTIKILKNGNYTCEKCKKTYSLELLLKNNLTKLTNETATTNDIK